MDPNQILLTKCARFLRLTAAEREGILALPMRVEKIEADQPILREGTRPKHATLLLQGLACNSKMGLNGRRQILAFHIPEDAPDLTSFHLEVRDSDSWALTPCTLALIDHGDLDRFCEAHHRLAKFLWRTTLVDASVHREWTMNVGLRDAISRMAHLLCEMMTRMEAIDQARDGSCAFPATQGDLAEATSLSNVHVNRMLQALRGQGLITFAKGVLTIHDRDRLAEMADFRTDYLHLPPTMAA